MFEDKAILDRIKEEFIEISTDKFERIKKFLNNYWDLIKSKLGIENTEENNEIYQLNELINYYDPKKTPATRLNLIESLPNLHEIIKQYSEIKDDLEKMEEVKILYRIKRINHEYFLMTPEGFIFLLALKKSKKYDNSYRLNTLVMQNYLKFLSEKYREFIFEKFNNLQIIKKEIPSFTNKDIAILLFFLINGSISEEKAFNRDKRGSEKALNCVVQTFHKDRELFNEDRNDEKIVPIRVLQSDLSVLQKKIGYAIIIEQGNYFIKSSEVSFIIEKLKESLKEKKENKESLVSRWKKLLKEYNHWRPILRQNKICYYDYQVVENLENFILEL